MYIEPRGIIRILREVPLDNTYDHTLYWANATDQANYFASKVKASASFEGKPVVFTLNNQSYSRPNRGYIRVEIPADFLYDCNYIMFQNTNFGARWFYAFIKKVNYIANWVTEIEFQMDVMQTWFFDYQPEQCFIEREHSVTDNIGENTIPENLEIGDYIFIDGGNSFNNSNVPPDFDPWQIDPPEYPSDFCVCICAPFKIINIFDTPSFTLDSTAGFYNGVFSGLYYNVFNLDSLQDWENIVEYLSEGQPGDLTHAHLSSQRREEIAAIFMMPKYLVSEWSKYPNASANGVGVIKQKHYNWEADTSSGYTPKNNKLYTYPFNTLYITSSDGDSAYFKYELFNQTFCSFMLEGAMGVPPEIGLTPVQYAMPSSTGKNYNYTLSVKNVPMCSWVTDAFKAWLAQNATRIVAGTALTVAGGMAGAGVIQASSALSGALNSAKMAGAIGELAKAREQANTIGMISGINSNLAQIVPAALQPDHTHGVSKASLGIANNEFGYHYYYARIKDEFAMIIDDYFSRFGYATKRTKIPNRSSRPHWNYVKTIGCTITGSIPVDDAKSICTIYDNGITFWKNPSEVGNYGLDNSAGGT